MSVHRGPKAIRDFSARGRSIYRFRASTGDFHSQIDDAEQLDHLAQRLSRERVKTTTLDLIDVAEFTKAQTKRERSREKELDHEL